MTPIHRISVAAALATAALVLGTPAAAQADPSGRADFGQHVPTCAQTMGFTGSHNPGMHQGYTGWDGMACQM
jgi:Spy/CpxP family protein refolding chaperone